MQGLWFREFCRGEESGKNQKSDFFAFAKKISSISSVFAVFAEYCVFLRFFYFSR
jgi:hypothetical protein